MDCEKFDQHVIEALYDELDELTHAALKRHVEGCSRCASVWAGLRATREVGILPLEEPPADLEDRILEAAAGAQRRAPWPKKVLRGLAWAGSHAMRPQLAMAALFFLVIGSSLLLLRARPGTMAPVAVTERGSPSPDPEQAGSRAAAAPTALATASPVAVAATEGTPAATGALSDGARSRAVAGGDDAPADLSLARGKGSADEGRAALTDARTTRDGAGCAAAVAKLDAVAVAYRGTQFAADAMWDEATCYAQMGDAQKAQQLYLALRSTGYRERAEAQLASAEAKNPSNNVTNQSAGAAAVAARAAPATPAPPAAAPPAEASANNARNAAGPANAGRAAPRPAKATYGDPGRAYRAAPAKDAAGF